MEVELFLSSAICIDPGQQNRQIFSYLTKILGIKLEKLFWETDKNKGNASH